ncbi:uncharacterized protein LOC135810925 [Sycon ciliatum]|uniref:uncharacterized protein LOC135810925 n=1 Tax=Sycon ciliatum TaxID=27933 RepID=UPI0031F6AF38
MLSCLEKSPSQRPSFDRLVSTLVSILDTEKHYMEFSGTAGGKCPIRKLTGKDQSQTHDSPEMFACSSPAPSLRHSPSAKLSPIEEESVSDLQTYSTHCSDTGSEDRMSSAASSFLSATSLYGARQASEHNHHQQTGHYYVQCPRSPAHKAFPSIVFKFSSVDEREESDDFPTHQRGSIGHSVATAPPTALTASALG